MNSRDCRGELEQALYAHVRELAAEMNLRLFLDRENGFCWEADPNRALFVEGIFIVDIRYPKEKESVKRGWGIRRIGRFFFLLWKWIIKGFTDKGSSRKQDTR